MRTGLRRLGRWLADRGQVRARWALFAGGAAATALLLALCSRMEAPWFALGCVALVPWLAALERAASWREAAGAGAVMSVAFVVFVFSWFPVAIGRYADASPPLLWLLMILAAPVLEPQFIAFALVRRLARGAPSRGSALRAALAGACAYVGAELLVPKLFFDTLGHGLYPSLYLRQGADIAGVHGLTLLLLLVNEGILATLRRWASAPAARAAAAPGGALPDPGSGGLWRSRAARGLIPLSGALALLGADLAYGFFRVAELQARSRAPGPLVGVVQANITNYDKLKAEQGAFEAVRLILDTHYALSDEIRGRERPDLIVWPETVYPTTFGAPKSEAGAAMDAEIAAFVKSRGVPLIFGAYESEGGREFNAAFFVSAAQGGGLSASSYRKRMLFPLTEWVPEALDSAWLRRSMPWTGRWARGPGPRVVQLEIRGGEPLSVVPLICYDVLFPGFVADAASRGADLIVTLSNDSWFPDARAPRLHLISAAFRSIETRLPQVRATNSGISAVIAPTGEILAATRWDERETLTASLPGAERRVTPAMAWGPWVGPGLWVSALLLLLQAKARSGEAPEPSRSGEAPEPSRGGEAPEARAGRPRPRQSRRRTRTKAGTAPK